MAIATPVHDIGNDDRRRRGADQFLASSKCKGSLIERNDDRRKKKNLHHLDGHDLSSFRESPFWLLGSVFGIDKR
jgi:hypothetical protein